MNLLGKKCILMISEPWEISRSVDGRIKFIIRMKNTQSSLWFVSADDQEEYLLSERYLGDEILDLQLNEKMVVAIGKLKGNKCFADISGEATLLELFDYYGRGSIEIIED